MEPAWRSHGAFAVVASEIEDDYDHEYCDNLFRAAKELDKLVRKCKIAEG